MTNVFPLYCKILQAKLMVLSHLHINTQDVILACIYSDVLNNIQLFL